MNLTGLNTMDNSTLLNNDTRNLIAAHWLGDITLICVIDGDDTPMDLSHKIKGFSLVARYDENQMPYFMVTLDLARIELIRIQNNAINVRFVISIKLKEDMPDDSTVAPPKEYQFIKNVACKPIDLNRFEALPEEGNATGSAMEAWRTELILFADDHLKLNGKVSQLLVSNSTVEGAITSLVQKFGSLSLMLSKPENQKSYRNIIVPPGNLTSSLHYLQDYYGIYSSGLKLFSDFEKTMIMPFDKFNQRKGSPNKLVIEIYDLNESSVYSTRPVISNDDLSSMIMRVSINSVTHNVNPVGEMFTVGENISYKNSDNSSHEVKMAKVGVGGVKVNKLFAKKQLTNKTSNPYMANSHIRKSNEAIEHLLIQLPNVLISALDIDTKIQVIYKSSQANNMNGDFRIRSLYVSFNRIKRGTNMPSDSLIDLVRI